MGFNFLHLLGQLFFLLVIPPFFGGIITKVKAFFSGRKGPPVLQPYYDLAKLFRKERIYSFSSSFLTRFVPPVSFILYLAAGLLFPCWGPSPIAFRGDLILFAYLLALSRFLILLMALDAGSSFEGMGASREATLGALSELAFFLGWVVLAVLSQTTSLSEIFQWKDHSGMFNPAPLLLFVSFFIILLTENCRIPIDDPSTHLELTMIHEVMILDLSGPDLALILYGNSIKLFIFMALAASLLAPYGPLGEIQSMERLLIKVTGIAFTIGVVESMNARLRWIKIPQLLMANFVMMTFALLVILFERGA